MHRHYNKIWATAVHGRRTKETRIRIYLNGGGREVGRVEICSSGIQIGICRLCALAKTEELMLDE